MPLVEIHGPGVDFRSRSSRILVGRNARCDIRFTDDIVSSRHAEIRAHGHQWIITDLKSTNGTWVAGRRIYRSTLLPPGVAAQIGAGGPVIYIVEPGEAGAAARRPAQRRPASKQAPGPPPLPQPQARRGFPFFKLILALLLLALGAWGWVEREAVGGFVSDLRTRWTATGSGGGTPEPGDRPTSIRKRDRVASRAELRRVALAAADAPRRWTAPSLFAYVAVSGDPVRAAQEFRGTPVPFEAPLIREGERHYVGVRVEAAESPLLFEWREDGLTVVEIDDLVAVGVDPTRCILLRAEADRVACRGEDFACVVRRPRTWPDEVGHAPRLPRRVNGSGRLEHRPAPGRDTLQNVPVGFEPVAPDEDPAEVAVAVWDGLVQSILTVDVAGTAVPLFLQFSDRPALLAGKVTLGRAIEVGPFDHPGLRFEVPKLPGGAPLPALGSENGYLVLGSYP